MTPRNAPSVRRTLVYCVLAATPLLLFSVFLTRPVQDAYSSELAVREYSPRGVEGGAVVPASCPSFAHVSGQCTPPSFSTNDAAINNGESTNLTWSCPSGVNTSSSGVNFSTGGALSGSTSVSPSNTTSYTVVCNSSGSSANLTVTVYNPSLTISASPTRVRSGNASIITWSASSVDSCSVSGPGISASGLSGSQSTGGLTNQSTYTLTCTTEGGSISASVIVTIAPAFEEI